MGWGTRSADVIIHIVALFVTLTFPYEGKAQSQNLQSCSLEETCRDCIQRPDCGWCSQPDLNDTSLERCMSLKNYDSLPGILSCEENYFSNPSIQLQYLQSEPISKGSRTRAPVQLEPQRVALKLRIDQPFNLTITYGQAQDYPIDLYYLMDLSKSMEDDKNTVSFLGASLAETMGKMTSDFRIGFGAFVDKVTMPFVSTSPKKLESPCLGCVKPFSFHHILSLTSDMSQFTRNVDKARVSGNLDVPEGGFDALMQAIVCEEQIGWRPNARRLIIFSTDASFHYAGDGKLGGILEPNDGECHLDEDRMYTHSTLLDYPSVAQINSKVKEKSITVIFAVTGDQISTYRDLSAAIQGSGYGELSKNSSNVVELVKEEYEKITSEVKLRDTLDRNGIVQISYFSNCTGARGSSIVQGNKCSGLKAGSTVSFEAEIRITKCPENRDDWKQSFDIQVIGIEEKLTVELEFVCECGCEVPGSEGFELKSDFCNGVGTSMCGVCACDNQHYGKHCQCDSFSDSVLKEGSQAELRSCRQDNTTNIICSNRGDCICGQCECHGRPDPNEKIEGKYCQCDNFSCRQVVGQVCSGSDHGTCVCGDCKCTPGWTGEACECSASRDDCSEPGSDEICSGKGKCRCNRCECEAGSDNTEAYSGRYCEKCPSCPDKCSELSSCVQCKMYKTGSLSDFESCQGQCKNLPEVEPVEIATSDEAIGERYCSFTDDSDNCRFFYVYGYNSSNNNLLYIRAQRAKDCPLVQPLTGIIGGVVITTLIIGLIILCLVKVLMNIQEKREYAKFEKEQASALWDKGENPLYKDPNSVFFNPGYGGA